MIKFILIILICYCSAVNNSFLGYDFGQYYSRIRIFEYGDYSDVKFLKFNIDGPTTLANWSLTTETDGSCKDYLANIHFDLQHGAYPLIAPQNESFPETYISTRHDLITTVFNRTVSNGTIRLKNPLRGTWFAMAFVERLFPKSNSKSSSSNCNIYLTTWLNYEAMPISLMLTLNQKFNLTLSNNTSVIYAAYYTSPGSIELTILSEWFSTCEINILGRINGLPSVTQYDYQTVCTNGPCLIEIDQLAAFVWIYFQISVKNVSCVNNPINGSMLIYSTECLSNASNTHCIPSYPTRRLMFNYYYNFLYIPRYSYRNTTAITLNGNDSSIYAYEFIVDDRNIGGTIHLDFETIIKSYVSSNANVSIIGCLSKTRPRRYDACEVDYRFHIDENDFITRSLPYPEMALWYLTLEYNCNNSMIDCANASISVKFQISSTQCTQEQCGTYGSCKILTSQQNMYSTCICVAGYRGYGCTDSSQSYASTYIKRVLFLTLSNLMFIPAICLAVYYRLFIEALVYFFNMFFSTFYHACDQEILKFCMFKYDGLQLSDFIGSYSSFVITLISMSIVPRSIKVFLFMLGLMTCVVINSRDRFDSSQFIAVTAITFGFTLVTWITVSISKRRLQPSFKQLLITLPGVLLASIGLILFTVVETDDNYWYTHSLWHMLMGTSILFFLRKKIGQNARTKSSDVANTPLASSTSSIGIVNNGASEHVDDLNNMREIF